MFYGAGEGKIGLFYLTMMDGWDVDMIFVRRRRVDGWPSVLSIFDLWIFNVLATVKIWTKTQGRFSHGFFLHSKNQNRKRSIAIQTTSGSNSFIWCYF